MPPYIWIVLLKYPLKELVTHQKRVGINE